MKTLPLCVLLVTFCLTACQEPEIEDPDTGLSSVLTPSATGVTLEASALGDFTLLDNHSIAEDEELAFPLVGMIPYLFKLAGGEDLRAFADEAAKQGFSEEDYLLLLDAGFFALTKVRREWYTTFLGRFDNSDPRSIITSLTAHLTSSNQGRDKISDITIQQDYLVPNCSLGHDRCTINIDLSISLKLPELPNHLAALETVVRDTQLYNMIFDDLELELVNFTLKNSTSRLDLTLEPMVVATMGGIAEYTFTLDSTNQNKLLGNLTNVEDLALNLKGKFTNLFTAEDGSIKTSVVEGSLLGSIASTVLTSDLTADSADGEIKGADYKVQLRSEFMDIIH